MAETVKGLTATFTFRASPRKLALAHKRARAAGQSLAQRLRLAIDELVEGERPPAWFTRIMKDKK